LIFVTVGMHSKGFNRLVMEMDEIASKIDEKILIQIGNSDYLPKYAHYFRFKSQEDMLTQIESARVVVSQAGAGSIITALNLKKKLILFPRLQQYGEVIDDHQLELFYRLTTKNMVLGTTNSSDLSSLIEKSYSFFPSIINQNSLQNHLKELLSQFLNIDSKIGLVCSHGGHLTEIFHLISAFKDYHYFFITYNSPRTLRLKEKKYLLSNIGKNPFLGVLSLLKIFRIFLVEKPNVIISTGSEIAIPAIIMSRLFKIRSIYIETFCRITSPSLTGRIIYPLSDVFIIQWESLKRVYGNKAFFGGSLI